MLKTVLAAGFIMSASTAMAKPIVCNDQGCTDWKGGGGAVIASVSGGGTAMISEARRYIGMNARQIGLHRTTLWCSTFLNHVAKRTGKRGTGSDMARSWASHGRRVSGPQVGAIAVMSRGKRGGHVGIVTGIDSRGNPIIISGNHNRRVAETAYSRGRIYAYVVL